MLYGEKDSVSCSGQNPSIRKFGQRDAGSSAEGEFTHAVKRFSGPREHSVPLWGMKANEEDITGA